MKILLLNAENIEVNLPDWVNVADFRAAIEEDIYSAIVEIVAPLGGIVGGSVTVTEAEV